MHNVLYMVRHDPLAIVGFLLLGASAVLFVHIQFKMRQVGYKTYPPFARPYDWTLPLEYLRIRSKHGWSPWPAYLAWPCLGIGILVLVLGLFRL